MKILRVLLITTFLVFVFYACSGEGTPYHEVYDQVDSDSYDKINSDLRWTKSQYFKILTNVDTVIETDKETKIIISSGTFASNSGTAFIEVGEYYDIPSMIINKLFTSSGGKILETDGMLYVKVTDSVSGKILEPLKNVEISIPKQNINAKEMKLFFGSENDSNVDWELSETSGFIEYMISEDQYDTIYIPVVGSEYARIFSTTRLGWINVDKFLEIENKTDLFVSLPMDQTGVVYSLVFYSYNSILPGIPNDKGVLEFKGVPANEKVTLIALGSKDEKLYYSALDLTTDTKNAKLSPLQETSKEQLQTELENKFGNSLSNRHQPSF